MAGCEWLWCVQPMNWRRPPDGWWLLLHDLDGSTASSGRTSAGVAPKAIPEGASRELGSALAAGVQQHRDQPGRMASGRSGSSSTTGGVGSPAVARCRSEGSPLAAASHLSIGLSVAENTEEYLPMTSRIVQLAVLDVLATGMTLRRGESILPHLARIKDSLKSTRFPSGD